MKTLRGAWSLLLGITSVAVIVVLWPVLWWAGRPLEDGAARDPELDDAEDADADESAEDHSDCEQCTGYPPYDYVDPDGDEGVDVNLEDVVS